MPSILLTGDVHVRVSRFQHVGVQQRPFCPDPRTAPPTGKDLTTVAAKAAYGPGLRVA
jgi:hypothetical protein